MENKWLWLAKPYVQRAVVTGCALLFLAIYIFVEVMPLFWLGLTLYILSMGIFLHSLIRSIIVNRRVTAELLIVSVMVVSLLNETSLSGAIVAWFISLGLMISNLIMERTRRRIGSLVKERCRVIRVLKGDAIKETPIEHVNIDDIVVVPQGEMIPVDGKVVEGASQVDEAVVTGEPFPVLKESGDEVISGSINLSSPIKVKAGKKGDRSFLYLMSSEIEEALKKKPKTHVAAEKIVQVFILSVVTYSVILFLVTSSLERMATALAIACPCAWALATPTAFAALIGNLSKHGILVRGGIPLETSGKASFMVLDKTGTLTLAQPKVEEIIPIKLPKEEVLKIAASVESGFNHPLANAIVDYAIERGASILAVDKVKYRPSLGVQALVEGRKVIIGSDYILEELGLVVPPNVKREGRMVWVAVDRDVVGAVIIQDKLREYATGLAEELRPFGVKRIVLATGDNEEGEARRVAEAIGVQEYYWGYRPEDKAELVKSLRQQGVTVMAGDGINDAPALAAADVSIAMGSTNADLAIKSSDIVVLREDAKSLITIMRAGKGVRSVIKQNYTWAILFNTIGIGLVTLGFLSPPIAAILHHVSSVFVVSNSARLLTH